MILAQLNKDGLFSQPSPGLSQLLLWSEFGTYKRVKAIPWPWLSGTKSQNTLS